MDMVKRFFRALFTSRKAVALLAGLILKLCSPLLMRAGYELTPDDVNWALGLIASYIVGQGLSDVGVARAQVEAAAADERLNPRAAPPLPPIPPAGHP